MSELSTCECCVKRTLNDDIEQTPLGKWACTDCYRKERQDNFDRFLRWKIYAKRYSVAKCQEIVMDVFEDNFERLKRINLILQQKKELRQS